MADIELVIKIPVEDYSVLLRSDDNTIYPGINLKLVKAVKNGTQLPKGRWIRKEQDDGVWCECSNCGHRSLLEYDYTGFEDDWETWDMFDFSTIPLQNKNYCSSCGAKMEVEDAESEDKK